MVVGGTAEVVVETGSGAAVVVPGASSLVVSAGSCDAGVVATAIVTSGVAAVVCAAAKPGFGEDAGSPAPQADRMRTNAAASARRGVVQLMAIYRRASAKSEVARISRPRLRSRVESPDRL